MLAGPPHANCRTERRQVHACVRWPGAWVQLFLDAQAALTTVDESKDFDAVRDVSIDDAIWTFDDLPDLRAPHFGDHASGIRERSQLRCACEDALDHPLRIEGRRLGDMLA